MAQHRTVLLRVLAVVMVTAMVVTVGNGARVVSGQTVCEEGGGACYKMAYFRDVSSRVSFSEALQACDTDGGSLLSIESDTEQKTIQDLLQELRSGAGSDSGITDGDFWIGLTRPETASDQTQSTSCPQLYYWTDGSPASFRNWYEDEPSCGGEACVVMYHQPTALPGLGGAYMHQWNDDRCNMKHNFICKYNSDGKAVDEQTAGPTTESSSVAAEATSEITSTNSGMLLLYVVIPTIPLLLLILVASGSCCCQRISKTTKPRTKTAADQSTLWISPSPKEHV